MKRMKGWKITGMLLIVTALVCFGILAVIVTDTGGDMSSFIKTVPENIDNAAKVLTAAKEDLLQSKGLEERIALWKEA